MEWSGQEKKINETKQIWMSISPKMSFYITTKNVHILLTTNFFLNIKISYQLLIHIYNTFFYLQGA